MTEASWVKVLQIADSDEMHELGIAIGKQLRAGDLAILTGDLGAGKTTLSRGIGEGMQVRGPVTSPTFVLARTHPSLIGGAPLIHVDAYRLADALEFDDLDLDFANSAVIVEWGRGKIDPGANWFEIEIVRATGAEVDEIDFDETEEPRTVKLNCYGDRWKAGLKLHEY